MQIRELARLTDTDPATIRYYEREHLLPVPTKASNGYRRYGRESVKRLTFIRHCRSLDIPLRDVRRLLSLIDAGNAGCCEIDAMIDAHLVRVQQRRRELQLLEAQLRDLRSLCPAQDRAGECGIMDGLVQAARGDGCACHRDREQAP